MSVVHKSLATLNMFNLYEWLLSTLKMCKFIGFQRSRDKKNSTESILYTTNDIGKTPNKKGIRKKGGSVHILKSSALLPLGMLG
jgi:hypothetical protein